MRPLDEGEVVTIALRIPKELKERFREACGERAMSDVLRSLMERHLEKTAPTKKRRTKKGTGNGRRGSG